MAAKVTKTQTLQQQVTKETNKNKNQAFFFFASSPFFALFFVVAHKNQPKLLKTKERKKRT